MRHRKSFRKLSRTWSHRRALLRNLVTALFQYERIETTVAKAKEARQIAERLITFAKRGDMAARRHVDRFVMKPEITAKLFATIAPWYAERPGGYTRIIRIGRRLGDAGETAYLELVKSVEQKEQERQARLAAAEAKETALKGEKPGKKPKAEAASEGAAEEGARTKRGRSRTSVKPTGPAPPSKKKSTTRKVGAS
ncbi:MAG: 50S ribosomal protein L17 [Candidatus Eisenbacteria bacterium]|uniref:Large ribosomal subunit protein bL17 n=1 Tax=Eiseniibacteriota bacterium TaxID=2212470 RepID=A0A849SDQ4_UNCEI|nr:50S ribosomal protein L17 [Candidatus Eisenbacteria bacterium]